MRSTIGFKFIAGVLAFLFILNDMGQAAPALDLAAAFRSEVPRVSHIQIPPEMATLEDWYESPRVGDTRLMLHIQDAHAQPEAQARTRDLIHYLNKQYGFKTVFVEGAAEQLDVKWLHPFKNPEQNKKWIEEKTSSGEMSGVDLALLDKVAGLKALPIETIEGYRGGYQKLRAVYSAEPAIKEFTDFFDSKLDSASSKFLNDKTRSILSEWRKFELGHREFLPFVEKLAVLAKEDLELDLNAIYSQIEWPQISRLLVLQRIEKELSQQTGPVVEGPISKADSAAGSGIESQSSGRVLRAQSDLEKQKLIKDLQSKHAAPGIVQGLERFDEKNLNLNRITVGDGRQFSSPRALIELLVEETGKLEINLRDYPAFLKYAGYLILRGELHPSSLFKEIERLFEKLLEKTNNPSAELRASQRLTTSVGEDVQRQALSVKLIEIYRDSFLLKKLLNLELSREEWQKAVVRRQEIEPLKLLARLKDFRTTGVDRMPESVVRENNLGLSSLGDDQKQLQVVCEQAFAFYDSAMAREGIFFDKISAALAQNDKAILVTGGFHTEGMNEYFREKEISYGTLTPRITNLAPASLYRAAMMQAVNSSDDSSQPTPALAQSPEAIAAMTALSEVGVRSESRLVSVAREMVSWINAMKEMLNPNDADEFEKIIMDHVSLFDPSAEGPMSSTPQLITYQLDLATHNKNAFQQNPLTRDDLLHLVFGEEINTKNAQGMPGYEGADDIRDLFYYLITKEHGNALLGFVREYLKLGTEERKLFLEQALLIKQITDFLSHEDLDLDMDALTAFGRSLPVIQKFGDDDKQSGPILSALMRVPEVAERFGGRSEVRLVRESKPLALGEIEVSLPSFLFESPESVRVAIKIPAKGLTLKSLRDQVERFLIDTGLLNESQRIILEGMNLRVDAIPTGNWRAVKWKKLGDTSNVELSGDKVLSRPSDRLLSLDKHSYRLRFVQPVSERLKNAASSVGTVESKAILLILIFEQFLNGADRDGKSLTASSSDQKKETYEFFKEYADAYLGSGRGNVPVGAGRYYRYFYVGDERVFIMMDALDALGELTGDSSIQTKAQSPIILAARDILGGMVGRSEIRINQASEQEIAAHVQIIAASFSLLPNQISAVIQAILQKRGNGFVSSEDFLKRMAGSVAGVKKVFWEALSQSVTIEPRRLNGISRRQIIVAGLGLTGIAALGGWHFFTKPQSRPTLSPDLSSTVAAVDGYVLFKNHAQISGLQETYAKFSEQIKQARAQYGADAKILVFVESMTPPESLIDVARAKGFPVSDVRGIRQYADQLKPFYYGLLYEEKKRRDSGVQAQLVKVMGLENVFTERRYTEVYQKLGPNVAVEEEVVPFEIWLDFFESQKEASGLLAQYLDIANKKIKPDFFKQYIEMQRRYWNFQRKRDVAFAQMMKVRVEQLKPHAVLTERGYDHRLTLDDALLSQAGLRARVEDLAPMNERRFAVVRRLVDALPVPVEDLLRLYHAEELHAQYYQALDSADSSTRTQLDRIERSILSRIWNAPLAGLENLAVQHAFDLQKMNSLQSPMMKAMQESLQAAMALQEQVIQDTNRTGQIEDLYQRFFSTYQKYWTERVQFYPRWFDILQRMGFLTQDEVDVLKPMLKSAGEAQVKNVMEQYTLAAVLAWIEHGQRQGTNDFIQSLNRSESRFIKVDQSATAKFRETSLRVRNSALKIFGRALVLNAVWWGFLMSDWNPTNRAQIESLPDSEIIELESNIPVSSVNRSEMRTFDRAMDAVLTVAHHDGMSGVHHENMRGLINLVSRSNQAAFLDELRYQAAGNSPRKKIKVILSHPNPDFDAVVSAVSEAYSAWAALTTEERATTIVMPLLFNDLPGSSQWIEPILKKLFARVASHPDDEYSDLLKVVDLAKSPTDSDATVPSAVLDVLKIAIQYDQQSFVDPDQRVIQVTLIDFNDAIAPSELKGVLPAVTRIVDHHKRGIEKKAPDEIAHPKATEMRIYSNGSSSTLAALHALGLNELLLESDLQQRVMAEVINASYGFDDVRLRVQLAIEEQQVPLPLQFLMMLAILVDTDNFKNEDTVKPVDVIIYEALRDSIASAVGNTSDVFNDYLKLIGSFLSTRVLNNGFESLQTDLSSEERDEKNKTILVEKILKGDKKPFKSDRGTEFVFSSLDIASTKDIPNYSHVLKMAMREVYETLSAQGEYDFIVVRLAFWGDQQVYFKVLDLKKTVNMSALKEMMRIKMRYNGADPESAEVAHGFGLVPRGWMQRKQLSGEILAHLNRSESRETQTRRDFLAQSVVGALALAWGSLRAASKPVRKSILDYPEINDAYRSTALGLLKLRRNHMPINQTPGSFVPSRGTWMKSDDIGFMLISDLLMMLNHEKSSISGVSEPQNAQERILNSLKTMTTLTDRFELKVNGRGTGILPEALIHRTGFVANTDEVGNFFDWDNPKEIHKLPGLEGRKGQVYAFYNMGLTHQRLKIIRDVFAGGIIEGVENKEISRLAAELLDRADYSPFIDDDGRIHAEVFADRKGEVLLHDGSFVRSQLTVDNKHTEARFIPSIAELLVIRGLNLSEDERYDLGMKYWEKMWHRVRIFRSAEMPDQSEWVPVLEGDRATSLWTELEGAQFFDPEAVSPQSWAKSIENYLRLLRDLQKKHRLPFLPATGLGTGSDSTTFKEYGLEHYPNAPEVITPAFQFMALVTGTEESIQNAVNFIMAAKANGAHYDGLGLIDAVDVNGKPFKDNQKRLYINQGLTLEGLNFEVLRQIVSRTEWGKRAAAEHRKTAQKTKLPPIRDFGSIADSYDRAWKDAKAGKPEAEQLMIELIKELARFQMEGYQLKIGVAEGIAPYYLPAGKDKTDGVNHPENQRPFEDLKTDVWNALQDESKRTRIARSELRDGEAIGGAISFPIILGLLGAFTAGSYVAMLATAFAGFAVAALFLLPIYAGARFFWRTVVEEKNFPFQNIQSAFWGEWKLLARVLSKNISEIKLWNAVRKTLSAEDLRVQFDQLRKMGLIQPSVRAFFADDKDSLGVRFKFHQKKSDDFVVTSVYSLNLSRVLADGERVYFEYYDNSQVLSRYRYIIFDQKDLKKVPEFLNANRYRAQYRSVAALHRSVPTSYLDIMNDHNSNARRWSHLFAPVAIGLAVYAGYQYVGSDVMDWLTLWHDVRQSYVKLLSPLSVEALMGIGVLALAGIVVALIIVDRVFLLIQTLTFMIAAVPATLAYALIYYSRIPDLFYFVFSKSGTLKQTLLNKLTALSEWGDAMEPEDSDAAESEASDLTRDQIIQAISGYVIGADDQITYFGNDRNLANDLAQFEPNTYVVISPKNEVLSEIETDLTAMIRGKGFWERPTDRTSVFFDDYAQETLTYVSEFDFSRDQVVVIDPEVEITWEELNTFLTQTAGVGLIVGHHGSFPENLDNLPGYGERFQVLESDDDIVTIYMDNANRSESRLQSTSNQIIDALQSYANWLSAAEYDLSASTVREQDQSFSDIGAFLVLGNPDAKTFIEFAKGWYEVNKKVQRQVPIVIAGGIGRGTLGLIDTTLEHYRRLGRLNETEEKLLLEMRTQVETYLEAKALAASTGSKTQPEHPGVTEKNVIMFIFSKEGVGRFTVLPKKAQDYDHKLNYAGAPVYFENGNSTNTPENFEFSRPVIESLVQEGLIQPDQKTVIVTELALLARIKPTLLYVAKEKGWQGDMNWPRARVYPLDLKRQFKPNAMNAENAQRLLDKILYWAGPSQRMIEMFPDSAKNVSELKKYADQYWGAISEGGLDFKVPVEKLRERVPEYSAAEGLIQSTLMATDEFIDALVDAGYEIKFDTLNRTFTVTARSESRMLDPQRDFIQGEMSFGEAEKLFRRRAGASERRRIMKFVSNYCDPAKWEIKSQAEREYAAALSAMSLADLKEHASYSDSPIASLIETYRDFDTLVTLLTSRLASRDGPKVSLVRNWTDILTNTDPDILSGMIKNPEDPIVLQQFLNRAFIREIFYRWDTKTKERSAELFKSRSEQRVGEGASSFETLRGQINQGTYDALQHIRDAVAQTELPLEIILFGSYADGYQGLGSDLDILFTASARAYESSSKSFSRTIIDSLSAQGYRFEIPDYDTQGVIPSIEKTAPEDLVKAKDAGDFFKKEENKTAWIISATSVRRVNLLNGDVQVYQFARSEMRGVDEVVGGAALNREEIIRKFIAIIKGEDARDLESNPFDLMPAEQKKLFINDMSGRFQTTLWKYLFGESGPHKSLEIGVDITELLLVGKSNIKNGYKLDFKYKKKNGKTGTFTGVFTKVGDEFIYKSKNHKTTQEALPEVQQLKDILEDRQSVSEAHPFDFMPVGNESLFISQNRAFQAAFWRYLFGGKNAGSVKSLEIGGDIAALLLVGKRDVENGYELDFKYKKNNGEEGVFTGVFMKTGDEFIYKIKEPETKQEVLTEAQQLKDILEGRKSVSKTHPFDFMPVMNKTLFINDTWGNFQGAFWKYLFGGKKGGPTKGLEIGADITELLLVGKSNIKNGYKLDFKYKKKNGEEGTFTGVFTKEGNDFIYKKIKQDISQPANEEISHEVQQLQDILNDVKSVSDDDPFDFMPVANKKLFINKTWGKVQPLFWVYLFGGDISGPSKSLKIGGDIAELLLVGKRKIENGYELDFTYKKGDGKHQTFTGVFTLVGDKFSYEKKINALTQQGTREQSVKKTPQKDSPEVQQLNDILKDMQSVSEAHPFDFMPVMNKALFINDTWGKVQMAFWKYLFGGKKGGPAKSFEIGVDITELLLVGKSNIKNGYKLDFKYKKKNGEEGTFTGAFTKVGDEFIYEKLKKDIMQPANEEIPPEAQQLRDILNDIQPVSEADPLNFIPPGNTTVFIYESRRVFGSKLWMYLFGEGGPTRDFLMGSGITELLLVGKRSVENGYDLYFKYKKDNGEEGTFTGVFRKIGNEFIYKTKDPLVTNEVSLVVQQLKDTLKGKRPVSDDQPFDLLDDKNKNLFINYTRGVVQSLFWKYLFGGKKGGPPTQLGIGGNIAELLLVGTRDIENGYELDFIGAREDGARGYLKAQFLKAPQDEYVYTIIKNTFPLSFENSLKGQINEKLQILLLRLATQKHSSEKVIWEQIRNGTRLVAHPDSPQKKEVIPDALFARHIIDIKWGRRTSDIRQTIDKFYLASLMAENRERVDVVDENHPIFIFTLDEVPCCEDTLTPHFRIIPIEAFLDPQSQDAAALEARKFFGVSSEMLGAEVYNQFRQFFGLLKQLPEANQEDEEDLLGLYLGLANDVLPSAGGVIDEEKVSKKLQVLNGFLTETLGRSEAREVPAILAEDADSPELSVSFEKAYEAFMLKLNELTTAEEAAAVIAYGFTNSSLSREKQVAMLTVLVGLIGVSRFEKIRKVMQEKHADAWNRLQSMVRSPSKNRVIYRTVDAAQLSDMKLREGLLNGMKAVWLVNPNQKFHLLAETDVSQDVLKQLGSEVNSWKSQIEIKADNFVIQNRADFVLKANADSFVYSTTQEELLNDRMALPVHEAFSQNEADYLEAAILALANLAQQGSLVDRLPPGFEQEGVGRYKLTNSSLGLFLETILADIEALLATAQSA